MSGEKAERRTRGVLRAIDDRVGSGTFLRNQTNKIFPDHWSFMLGELALYNFVILVLTGTYLTFFFRASETPVHYHGSYVPLQNVQVSDAYSSVLHISFDVRAGLLVRQIHHWAALLFVAAIIIHVLRIFLTGAFRKPRDVNWVIGTTLLILAIMEGFCGYSLPDDLLSGTGLRIAYSIIESIPVVGSYIAMFLFDGQYPGHEAIIPRLFIIHVFLIPGLLLALITAHLMIIWRQKHTQFPLPGRTQKNVVGSRLYPDYSLKSGGLFFGVFSLLVFLGACVQVNPIWLYGPYDPARVSAGSQPDWYMFWLEGSLRLTPRLESRFLGHTVDWNVFLPAVVLPLGLFLAMYAYPFIERFLTRDRGPAELCQRPRDHPVRTGIGMATLTFYVILSLAGANDLIPYTFGLDMMSFTWALRVLIVILPPAVFYVTRKACRRLQRARELDPFVPPDRATIVQDPSGGYVVATSGRTGAAAERSTVREGPADAGKLGIHPE